MIEPFTLIASITATVFVVPQLFVIQPIKLLIARKDRLASAIVDNYDRVMANGEDIEEYLEAQTDYCAVGEIAERLEGPKPEESLIDDVEGDGSKCQLLEDIFESGRKDELDDYTCAYELWHCYYNYCPVCQKKISVETPYESVQDVEEVEQMILFDPAEHNRSVMLRDEALRSQFRTGHHDKLAYLLADIIRAKYISLDDTKANRIVVQDHLTQWYERRAEKHKDIRRRDMIKYVPLAVELFFIPSDSAVLAAQIRDCTAADDRYFRVGNHSLIRRVGRAVRNVLWFRSPANRRGGGSQ